MPKTRPLASPQARMLARYKAVDPDCMIVGFHRGRPVVVTYLAPPGQLRTDRRGAVILQANGTPGDLPENWEDNFVWVGAPDSTLRALARGRMARALWVPR